jgi:ADP-ribosylglycohydrolase
MPTEVIKKADIRALIEDWADAHPGPNNTIKLSLGSNGASWTGDYKDAMLAICDGIAKSINETIVEHYEDLIETEVDKRMALRNKLQNEWKDKLNNVINEVNDLAGTSIEYLPNLPS